MAMALAIIDFVLIGLVAIYVFCTKFYTKY